MQSLHLARALIIQLELEGARGAPTINGVRVHNNLEAARDHVFSAIRLLSQIDTPDISPRSSEASFVSVDAETEPDPLPEADTLPEADPIWLIPATPLARIYVVWKCCNHTLEGIWWGSAPGAWTELRLRLPNQNYHASGARLRRFDSPAEALEGWYHSGPYPHPTLPPIVRQL